MRRRDLSLPAVGGAFEEVRADYSAAKSSRYRRRRTGYASTGSGADYHYRTEAEFLKLMEWSRDFDRNDMIVGQIVTRAVENMCQGGITLDVQTGDTGLDDELQERWCEWCEDPDQCDLAREWSFCDFEFFAKRSEIVDGDCFFLGTSGGSLQMIEAHRCRTPNNTTENVVHGVKLSANRERLQYWFTKDDIDLYMPLAKVGDINKFDARGKDDSRQVFHVYDPKRVSQTRGITAFAPIFDPIGMVEDINFAELVRRQVVSCFAVFRQRGIDFPGGTTEVKGPQSNETHSDGSAKLVEGLSPGMEIAGLPGETLQGFSPSIPGPQFFEHMRFVLTVIGCNLGMPLVMVLMDASETNFSGWRGAVDQARMGFRRAQKNLIQRFHKPVYLWKVRQWMADDPALRSMAAKDKVKVFGHIWQPPTWPYIEPLKDAQADLLRLRSGLISPRRLHAENGRDYFKLYRETAQDNAMAIVRAKKIAAKINAQFDDEQPVHWREILSLPAPEGVSVAIDTKPEPEPVLATPARKAPANA